MIVDLTQPLNQNTDVWPGDPPVSFRKACGLDTDGAEVNEITFSTHAGTHIEAPAHLIKGGRTLDSYKLDELTAQARVLNLQGVMRIDHKHLPPRIEEEIVLLYTGWDSKIHTPEYFTIHPILTPQAGQRLISLGVRIVAMDTPSPDRKPFNTHRQLFAKDVLIVEGLMNLSALGHSCKITIAPLSLENTEAAPCRVFAEL